MLFCLSKCPIFKKQKKIKWEKSKKNREWIYAKEKNDDEWMDHHTHVWCAQSDIASGRIDQRKNESKREKMADKK